MARIDSEGPCEPNAIEHGGRRRPSCGAEQRREVAGWGAPGIGQGLIRLDWSKRMPTSWRRETESTEQVCDSLCGLPKRVAAQGSRPGLLALFCSAVLQRHAQQRSSTLSVQIPKAIRAAATSAHGA